MNTSKLILKSKIAGLTHTARHLRATANAHSGFTKHKLKEAAKGLHAREHHLAYAMLRGKTPQQAESEKSRMPFSVDTVMSVLRSNYDMQWEVYYKNLAAWKELDYARQEFLAAAKVQLEAWNRTCMENGGWYL